MKNIISSLSKMWTKIVNLETLLKEIKSRRAKYQCSGLKGWRYSNDIHIPSEIKFLRVFKKFSDSTKKHIKKEKIEPKVKYRRG